MVVSPSTFACNVDTQLPLRLRIQLWMEVLRGIAAVRGHSYAQIVQALYMNVISSVTF